MTECEQGKGEANLSRISSPVSRDKELPYRIELWDGTDGASVERVLARAFSAPLARAIFKAVRAEHPDRRITLRRGSRIIADSTE